jgi:hypothetical protein
MLRQEQNDIILSRIADKLGDQPNVQVVLGKTFTQWFRALVDVATEQMQPLPKQQPQPQQQQQEPVNA